MNDKLGCDGTGISVYIVEDDADLREELALGLGDFGFTVRGFSCSREFYRGLLEAPCDIAVLDLGLPDEDGLSVAAYLNDISNTGIVVLTGRRDMDERVRGLLGGADAYLVKPVDLRELAATLISVHRRIGEVTAPPPLSATWVLAQDGWVLQTPNEKTVSLTPGERVLLQCLFEHANRTVSREQLIIALGHRPDYYLDHRLDMLVSRLRRKVGATGVNLPLRAVRGVGLLLTLAQ